MNKLTHYCGRSSGVIGDKGGSDNKGVTGGEGAWKSMKTSWVHCRLWLKVPTTYLLITDWVYSKCTHIICSTWNLWEQLCNIWNVTSTCTPHLIPHNSWQSFEISPMTFWKCFHHMVGGNILNTLVCFENILITISLFWEHHDHI